MKKETKKANFKIDLGSLLLITGALANVTMWIGAFSSTEAQGPVSMWINGYLLPTLGSLSGLAMGITAVSGLIFILARIASMQPTYERKTRGKDEYKTYVNYRYWMTVGVLALLVVVSWALLAPFAFSQLSGAANLYQVMGVTWSRWWSIGRVVAADLVIGGVALVQGAHPGAQNDSKPKANQSQETGKAGKKKATPKQPVRKPLNNDILLAYLAENKGQTQEQVAEYFGVRRQAIGARMKQIYELKNVEDKKEIAK